MNFSLTKKKIISSSEVINIRQNFLWGKFEDFVHRKDDEAEEMVDNIRYHPINRFPCKYGFAHKVGAPVELETENVGGNFIPWRPISWYGPNIRNWRIHSPLHSKTFSSNATKHTAFSKLTQLLGDIFE